MILVKPLGNSFRRWAPLAVALITCLIPRANISGQTGAGHTIFGDLTVDESQVEGLKPMSFDMILYTDGGRVVGRQTVSSKGRYKFTAIPNGNYELVVELENQEIARFRFNISSSFKNDFRQDIALKWQPNLTNSNRPKPNVISAADAYVRSPANQKLFTSAAAAMERKDYDHALVFLREVVDRDPNDFISWTELGTAYLAQNDKSEAGKAYEKALEVRPEFFPGLLNLGRLRLAEQKYEGAIAPLTAAVKIQPSSAIANYCLGEAFLQIKKGSKAVGYFHEALKLDPIGMADAHLRLAALYNAAGLKGQAAAEYEQFLKKRPDYPDRRKLQKFIAENAKK